MATKLYLRSMLAEIARGEIYTRLDGINTIFIPKRLSTIQGFGTVLALYANSVTGPTNGIELCSTTYGAAPPTYTNVFVSSPIAADITISGTITGNFWAYEANMTDNIAINFALWVLRADDMSMSLIAKSARVVELALTTPAVNNFTVVPTSTLIRRGDRLILSPFGDDVGTMGSGGSCVFYYEGLTGVNGDSWISLVENITFDADNTGEFVSNHPYTTNNNIWTFGGTSGAEQKANGFIAPPSGNLESITMWFANYGSPSDNLIVELRSDSAGKPSGTVIATIATISNTILPQQPSVLQCDFTGLNIAITPGTMYWVVFRRSGTLDNTNCFAIWSTSTSQPAEVQPNQWITSLVYQTGAWSINSNYGYPACKIVCSPTGKRLFLTNTNASGVTAGSNIKKELSTSRGSGSVATTTTTPIGSLGAGIQITDVNGGTPIEWYTKPLKSFTFGGMARIDARCDCSVNQIAVGCEIAVTNGDGSNPVIWGRACMYVEGSSGVQGGLQPNEADHYIFVSGRNIVVTDGQRLRIRLYFDNSTSAQNPNSVGTSNFYYGAATYGASGDSYIVLPNAIVESGPQTLFGATAMPIAFTKDVRGSKKTFGQLAQSTTFNSVISGKIVRTFFGSLAMPIAFGAVVDGRRKTLGQLAFPITFLKDVQGQRKTFGLTQSSYVFFKDVRGQRKTFGQIAFPITATIATAGSKLANIFYGVVALPVTFVKDVKGVRKTFGQTATSITFFKDVKGVRKAFGQIALPITFTKEVLGRKILFGQLSMQTLFGKEVAGIRKVFGQIALPITFTKDVNGRRKTFGQLLSPLIFGKDVRGQRQTFGQTVSTLLVSITTAGIKRVNTFYGVLSLPVTWAKDVKGVRKTFGQTATPFVFVKDVKGVRKTFGKIDLPLIFIKNLGGQQHLFGQLSMQSLFGKEVAGRRKTFGQIALPATFSKAVAGRKQTFGQVAIPINTTIVVSGFVRGTKKYGAISLPVIFDKEIIGRRKTFGQVTAPFIFGEASQGIRGALGKFYLPLDFDAAVKSGPVGIHGRIALPVIVSFETAGRIMLAGVVLNLAESIYLGVEPVLAVYTKNQQVWPLFVFDPTAITGLMGWYDASQLTLADGALVNPWPDLSGNNRPLAASTGYPVAPGTPPTCKINGLDGKRVVHYATNGDNLLVIPSQAMYGHIFIITKFNADAFPDYNGLISGQGDNTYFLIGTAGSNRFYPPSAEWGTIVYRSNGVIDPLRVAPMNTWKQINFSIGIPWTFRFQVGLDRVYPPRYWHGDIAEIVAYDRVLLDDERQRVEVYLQEKWGLT